MNLERLREIVGAEGLATGEATARWAVNSVRPAVVVAPESAEQAAAVILQAREEGWALTPYGGGTHIDFGHPPSRLDLVLSTHPLNRVVDYQPDDMTVTLEPGVVLADLQAVLAKRGQFLPLNPPFPERTTVGGMVAVAASGPWRAQFGTPRDWVIGCRVVGEDGREVRGGGLVVKNVAGYDLPKLYTGSFGTLGLLTEVTFKVMPAPPALGVCTITAQGPDQMEALVAAVQGSDLQPASFELLNPRDAVLEFRHVPEAVERQLQHTAGLAQDLGASFTRANPEAAAALLSAAINRAADLQFQARFNTMSSEACGLVAAVSALCARHQPDVRLNASLATGQVHVAASQGTLEFANALRAAGESIGATCVFPRLPSDLVGRVDPWGPVGPELRLMRGLKQTLDPRGMFSPGRFAGGL